MVHFLSAHTQKVRLHMNPFVHSADLAGIDHYKLITSKVPQQNKSPVNLT